MAASDSGVVSALQGSYPRLSGITAGGFTMSAAARSKGGLSGSFEGTAWWPGLGLAETRMWSRSNIVGKGVGGHLGKRQMYNTPPQVPKNTIYKISNTWERGSDDEGDSPKG